MNTKHNKNRNQLPAQDFDLKALDTMQLIELLARSGRAHLFMDESKKTPVIRVWVVDEVKEGSYTAATNHKDDMQGNYIALRRSLVFPLGMSIISYVAGKNITPENEEIITSVLLDQIQHAATSLGMGIENFYTVPTSIQLGDTCVADELLQIRVRTKMNERYGWLRLLLHTDIRAITVDFPARALYVAGERDGQESLLKVNAMNGDIDRETCVNKPIISMTSDGDRLILVKEDRQTMETEVSVFDFRAATEQLITAVGSAVVRAERYQETVYLSTRTGHLTILDIETGQIQIPEYRQALDRPFDGIVKGYPVYTGDNTFSIAERPQLTS